jgi:hypothetical protein
MRRPHENVATRDDAAAWMPVWVVFVAEPEVT